MDKNEQLIKNLLAMTEIQLGHGCNTTSDFDKLLIRIEKKTGEKISSSTLKRLWGYVSYPHTPSTTVLSILARFNGFCDWSNFCKSQNAPQQGDAPVSDSGFLAHDAASAMLPGEQIRIEWGGAKSCTIEKIGVDLFKVINSTNIKLQAADIVVSPYFEIGKAFYVSGVIRDGHKEGAYIAARNKGIENIVRLTSTDD